MRASVFIATSLDGFIAREDGAIDWLPVPAPGGEDYGYQEFVDGVDAVLMGRNTFDLVKSFDPWPYADKPMFVLSNRDLELAPDFGRTVERVSGKPGKVAADLDSRGIERVYLDGGRAIQEFLRAGLVGDLVITRVPVLIGKGIPLFAELGRDIRLRHTGTQAYPDGLVQSRFVVESG